jgi:hypothetical protein
LAAVEAALWHPSRCACVTAGDFDDAPLPRSRTVPQLRLAENPARRASQQGLRAQPEVNERRVRPLPVVAIPAVREAHRAEVALAPHFCVHRQTCDMMSACLIIQLIIIINWMITHADIMPSYY